MYSITFMYKPYISVCVPTHDMENGDYFLKRLQDSLDAQTFKDYEVVYTKEGKMAENTNAAIKKAKGDIIKILYMDDFFVDKDALKHIAESFDTGWLASGCVHTEDGNHFYNPHVPSYNFDIRSGNNTIGSPSVVAFENDNPLLFDESMTWLLDVDYYARLFERYGEPAIVSSLDIGIGIGKHQMTNLIPAEVKLSEFKYLKTKYG